MRRFAPLAVVMSALAIAMPALFFSGCTVSTEKDPAFQKLLSKVNDLEETQKTMKRSVEGLYLDIEALTEEAKQTSKNLKALATGGDSSAKVAEAIARLDKMDERLNAMKDALDTQQKELATARKTVQRTGTVASAESPAGAAKTGPVQEAAKPKGFYYKVQEGDTLQSIAEKFHLSSVAILKANRLPLTATPYPGQSIYIPQI